MKSVKTWIRILSLVLVFLLAAGCGPVSRDDSSRGEESAASQTQDACEEEISCGGVILPVGPGFVWDEDGNDMIRVHRDGYGEILLGWREVDPINVELSAEHTDTETARYWKYATQEIGMFDCKTSGHGNYLNINALFYVEGWLYDLDFTGDFRAVENGDGEAMEAWFAEELLPGIRLSEKGPFTTIVPELSEEPVYYGDLETPEFPGEITPEPSPEPSPEPEKETIDWEDMVSRLNDAAPEEFDGMYEDALGEISEKDLNGEWEIICQAVSAYTDYVNNPKLKYTADSYPARSGNALSAEYPGLPEGVSLYGLRTALNSSGLETAFVGRIYVPGCSLKVQAAIWMAADLAEYGYPDTAPERQPGDPVRILVVNNSDEVIVDGEGSCELSPQYAEDIREDVEKLWEGFFGDMEGASFTDAAMGSAECRVKIVTDPAGADLILTYTLSYPFAGSYGVTGHLSVYDCVADIALWQVGTENYHEYQYETRAGNTVSASPNSSKLWMHTPHEFDNELGRDVFAWYPDA